VAWRRAEFNAWGDAALPGDRCFHHGLKHIIMPEGMQEESQKENVKRKKAIPEG